MKFALVNHDPSITADELTTWAHALQRQLREHVAPAWGLDANAIFVSAGPMPDGARVAILVDPDQADALGYHDVSPTGAPYVRVFTAPTREEGAEVSGVVSHELVEALLDAQCNAWRDNGHESWAQEGCDAVQADVYPLDGVTVSNFVLPDFFDLRAPRAARFDYMGRLSRPFSMSPGGYTVVRVDGRERQRFAEGREVHTVEELPAHKRHPAARTARRFSRGA